jgi:hypothetical protein
VSIYEHGLYLFGFSFCVSVGALEGSSMILYDELHSISSRKHPFSYDLHPIAYKGSSGEEPVMIVCHGYGDNYRLGEYLQNVKVTRHHLVSFNFPDHDISDDDDHSKSSFGTISEILPLLYILKTCVVDFRLSAVSLYGFSAGGGAVINALAALQNGHWDKELEAVGISSGDKAHMMKALQAGMVILDCPLKSMEEVMDLRSKTPAFEILAQHYATNKMSPIDVLARLRDLTMTIFLHFENPDEIIKNRDDEIFKKRLLEANKNGRTLISSGIVGHNSLHTALWKNVRKES